MPAPAISVSTAWAWLLSPAPTAAATPPCAQAEDAPKPSGLGDNTVTGRGASLRAVNRPARPAPTIRAPSAFRLLSKVVMAGSLFKLRSYPYGLVRSAERRIGRPGRRR